MYIIDQTDDLLTKGNKSINIELTNKQHEILSLLTYKAGLKGIEEIIEEFVCGLSRCHAASVEQEDKANNWYELSFFNNKRIVYFKYFLYYFGYIQRLSAAINNEDEFDKIYEEYTSFNENLEHEDKNICLIIAREIIELKE